MNSNRVFLKNKTTGEVTTIIPYCYNSRKQRCAPKRRKSHKPTRITHTHTHTTHTCFQARKPAEMTGCDCIVARHTERTHKEYHCFCCLWRNLCAVVLFCSRRVWLVLLVKGSLLSFGRLKNKRRRTKEEEEEQKKKKKEKSIYKTHVFAHALKPRGFKNNNKKNDFVFLSSHKNNFE